ncbi:MAG TPA: acyltransferase [Acidimicrobiales bacterium]|nr:acyltransferase [Acidimicrobiales bacterium]
MNDLGGAYREAVGRFDDDALDRKIRLLGKAGVLAKVAPMLARGLLAMPRFGSVAGVPLIGRGVRLRGLAHVSAGRALVIEDYAEVQGTSVAGLKFGDRVTIGSFVQIRPTNYYSGELGVGLEVGDRSSIGPLSFIGCSGLISIGSDVMLSPGVKIFAETHVIGDRTVPMKAQGVDRHEIHIGDDCWIASGVIVTSGVSIGEGSVVGAGAVVTHDIPPFSVAVGNPARVVRTR